VSGVERACKRRSEVKLEAFGSALAEAP